MKSENDFNAYLGRELKKLSKKGFSHLKISDRFHPGVSDFFLWHQSIGSAIESKFIDNLPVRGTTKIMTHPFTGAQKGFFKRMEPGGAGRFGLVGIKRYKMMALIPVEHMKLKDVGYYRSKNIPAIGCYLKKEDKVPGSFARLIG